jgi:hypothetical protein
MIDLDAMIFYASGIRLLGWNEAASRDMVLVYIENITDITIFVKIQ